MGKEDKSSLDKLDHFIGNDFYHLTEKVNKIDRKLAFVDGKLWVVLGLLGVLVAFFGKVIFGV